MLVWEAFPIVIQAALKPAKQLLVKGCYTVSHLMLSIYFHMQIPLDELRLSLSDPTEAESKHTVLEGDKQLCEYGIKENSTVYLLPYIDLPRSVIIQPSEGKEFKLSVRKYELIETVKEMVFKETQIPVSEQHLFYNLTECLDEKTLAFYQIEPESAMTLVRREAGEPASQIHIKTLTGKTITIGVSANDTIEIIKQKIQDKEGFSPARQKLFYNNQLCTTYSTLRDCKIPIDGVLNLIVTEDKPTEGVVFVKTLTATLTIEVDLRGPVYALKRKIYERLGILPHEQRIVYASKQLNAEWTLEQCDVQNESTLFLVMRLLGGSDNV